MMWYMLDLYDKYISRCAETERGIFADIGVYTRQELVGENTYHVEYQDENGYWRDYGLLFHGEEAVIANGMDVTFHGYGKIIIK